MRGEVAERLRQVPRRADRGQVLEGLWWRCHRRLVADRLVVAGDDALDIGADGRASPHVLRPSRGCNPTGTSSPAPA